MDKLEKIYGNRITTCWAIQAWALMKQQLHEHRFKSDKLLICGDFNSNAIWHDHECWWNHLDVVRLLKRMDIISLYHDFFEEEQGQESQPTLYFRRKTDRSYHIDYAFAYAEIFTKTENFVEVGVHDEWLKHSDHMPVVFTINSPLKPEP